MTRDDLDALAVIAIRCILVLSAATVAVAWLGGMVLMFRAITGF